MTIIRGNLRGMDLSGLSQKEQFQLAVFYHAWNRPQPELMNRAYWKQEDTDEGYELTGQVNIRDICNEVNIDYDDTLDQKEQEYEDEQAHAGVTMPEDSEETDRV